MSGYLTGEQGPELWVPDAAGFVITAKDVARMFQVPVRLIVPGARRRPHRIKLAIRRRP